MKRFLLACFGLLSMALAVNAQRPGNNAAVQPVPPPGIKISDDDRKELEAGVADLGKEIESLRSSLGPRSPLTGLLPDVQIYHKAVDWALRYDEFYAANEVRSAKTNLLQAKTRLSQLRDGQAPWNTATGLVLRAYVSKIDDSIQPYGLIVPPSYHADSPTPYRLDFWFHGRGEKLSELSFINDRQRNFGEFTPPNTIVAHLYGRYCNGNRMAGEVDLFETLTEIKKHYPIDDNRILIRGFSMGGGSTWAFASHYPSVWAAAAPGAGFSETQGFLNIRNPTDLERTLWHLYDSIDWAINYYNLPLVAYSGEIDGQKQAADMMQKALAAEGLDMTHIIGPKTGHSYHKDSKIEINKRLDSIAAAGRNPVPRSVKFTTWSLRYNNSFWVTLDGMGKHFERARVDADLLPEQNKVVLKATNVTALNLSIPSGLCPLDTLHRPVVEINGQAVTAAAVQTDRSWKSQFVLNGGKWELGAAPTGLNKRHGLQGPVDDAFMDSFVIVKPTGTPLNEKVGAWATNELNHAIAAWRNQFRGDARTANDTEVGTNLIASSNLILFGDPSSNQLLKQIADKLPIKWTADGVEVNGKKYAADQHVPILIYPNPLNPEHYVVLNSGFTFREFDYGNNARQNPKLPDYAVVDISVPVSPRAPGGIVATGFFNEQWQLK